jgi:MFS family permease
VTEKPQGSYWRQLAESFQWKNLVANRDFFLILVGILLYEIAKNIFFPYLIIYLQHYLQLDTTTSSITIAVSILVGGIALAYPLGLLIDRWGRKPVALIAAVLEMVGLILFSFMRTLIPLVICGILWLAPLTAWWIATSTWSKDLFPEDKRGQFAGFYMLFWVMFPMILGPLTGGWLGATYGIKTVIDGQAAIIPTPLLFQVAGVATLLAAIPLWFVKEKKS